MFHDQIPVDVRARFMEDFNAYIDFKYQHGLQVEIELLLPSVVTMQIRAFKYYRRQINTG